MLFYSLLKIKKRSKKSTHHLHVKSVKRRLAVGHKNTYNMEISKKVGIWVRVSSQMSVDKDNHIYHEARAREFIKFRGWEVTEVYRLEALSGSSIMDYSETKRMLKDIDSGRISGLVFNKIARLARNTKELIEIADIFSQKNADLISMDMSIDTSTPIGRHFYRTMSSMAEFELETIKDRIIGNVISRAKVGRHIGGQAPFGFTYENKKLKPDKDEAPILKLMFELFVEHKRKKTVARILNERGYRTKQGNKFTDATVRRLLEEPVAKGVHIMNRRKSKSTKLKPREEWFFHEVEPVIDEELWQRVNSIIKTQKISKPLNLKVKLFTGYVFCSCGGRMYRKTGSPNYTCKLKCDNKIHHEDLEEVFRSELSNYTISENSVNEYLGKLNRTIEEKETELNQLTRKKHTLNTKIEKLIDLHLEGQIETKAFNSYHSEPYEQLIQVQNTIAELETELLSYKTNVTSSRSVIEEARSLYEYWDSFERTQKRNIIESTVEKIVIGEEDVEINLYKILPDGYMPSFLENKENGQHIL